MKTVGTRTVGGSLGGLVIGAILGGPIGAVVGAVLGGAGGNAIEPAAPGAAVSPVPGGGLNPGDMVVYDAMVPGLPVTPTSSGASAAGLATPIAAVLSPADLASLVAALGGNTSRTTLPLQQSGLLLTQVQATAAPAGSIAMAVADPRLPGIAGVLPVPVAGVLMKLSAPVVAINLGAVTPLSPNAPGAPAGTGILPTAAFTAKPGDSVNVDISRGFGGATLGGLSSGTAVVVVDTLAVNGDSASSPTLFMGTPIGAFSSVGGAAPIDLTAGGTSVPPSIPVSRAAVVP